jgi:glutamyl-tRNA reductase
MELERLKGELSGLPPQATDKVDRITRLLVEKLLLDPTEQLKALPDEETQAVFAEVLNRLFRLREDAADVHAPESSTRLKPRK